MTRLVLGMLAALLVLMWMAGAHGPRTLTAYTMPWCGACRRLQPEWARLERMAGPGLRVVKVNCELESCTGVTSYPTIICNGAVYSGPRTAEAMLDWASTRP